MTIEQKTAYRQKISILDRIHSIPDIITDISNIDIESCRDTYRKSIDWSAEVAIYEFNFEEKTRDAMKIDSIWRVI